MKKALNDYGMYAPLYAAQAKQVQQVIRAINGIFSRLNHGLLTPAGAGKRLYKVMEANRAVGAYDTVSREAVWQEAKRRFGMGAADKIWEQFE